MTLKTTMHRWTLATLLVAVSAATFAPAAFADHGSRRYKHDGRGAWGHPVPAGHYGGWRGSGSRVVIRQGYSGGGGSLLAGLVGGVILGTVLQSHAQPVVVHDSYCPPRVVEHVHYYSQPQVIERDDRYDDAPQYVAPQHDETPYLDPGTVYRFEDGNGERWWDTLDECTEAARGSNGPHVIKVVEDRSNRLVKTLYWSRDHWISDEDR